MLDRNKSFATQRRNVRKPDMIPFVETFKIQVEKLDFESLNAFEYKMDILKAIDENDFVKVEKIFDELEKIAKDSEDFPMIKNLSIKAEQMVRLSKL